MNGKPAEASLDKSVNQCIRGAPQCSTDFDNPDDFESHYLGVLRSSASLLIQPAPTAYHPSPQPPAPQACAYTDLILRRRIVEFGGARKVSERLDLVARQTNAREQTRA